MNERDLRQLLQAVAGGTLSPDEAVQRLRRLPFEDLGFAKLDHHRQLRTGFPEVIYCENKTPDQVAAIAARLTAVSPLVLATRASAEAWRAVAAACPQAGYHELARVIMIGTPEVLSPVPPPVLVMTAGTADLPVAEEAALIAESAGCPVERIFDVGVAGLHRLLSHLPAIQTAGALIVVAGMEGALASVVAGLASKPVIAVRTSVGYGASFGGLAALLAMRNSCATGMAVVNIDNGFGAGYMAAMICRNSAPPAP